MQAWVSMDLHPSHVVCAWNMLHHPDSTSPLPHKYLIAARRDVGEVRCAQSVGCNESTKATWSDC